MHIDLWIGRTILGRYEKTGTSWLGNFVAGNIRYGCITAGSLLEKSSMVFGITAGDIYAYTGLEYKRKYWIWGCLLAVGAYIGMTGDECVRAVGMYLRWKSGKWKEKGLVKSR